ncbi:MAG: toll/interleukin-1 receptor domain-containing protein, partial [Anaerolineae bacterium]|nr:toll/interleukin-1 receptor domain-containing protein [Anaerolineae bacterium]
MTDQTTDPKTLSLFYSYSHKDERYRDQLATHLKILERQSIISAWHDRQITAGEEWAGEIDEHLDIADIILLLVSPDFIASDYCWGIEVETAMRRHVAGEALVVPVIVRPVDWTSTLFSKLQALPKDGKAVTLWSNRDKAWVDVAKGIRRAAKEVAKGLEQQVPQVSSAPAAVQVSEPATPARAEPVRPTVREGGQLRRTIFTAGNGNTLPGDVVRSEGDPPTG